MLKIINHSPGMNTKQLKILLEEKYPDISIDMIKNALKRSLNQYCEFKGSKKSGGYYLKSL